MDSTGQRRIRTQSGLYQENIPVLQDTLNNII